MNRELIEKIKAANDIVEVVSEKVALRRAGARWKGLSPFTNEKTPSFFVNPDMQFFHCFSTNEGGDVVKFVMLTQGLSFPEALQYLGKRAGIAVEQQALSPEERQRRTVVEEEQRILLKINRFAAAFFQEKFWGPEGATARAYAEQRGLSKKTLEAFAIGFAPDSWSSLRDYLNSIKAPLPQALKLGLLRAKNEEEGRADGANLYDFFRNRLIFPIRNTEDEVIGFGGRALSPDAKEVKYLNSPESAVYDKGRSLYNLDRARKYIREAETAILVEGYMDCIALDQAGIGNVVANLGTALTPHHVQMLTKMASKVICLYDSDAAGQRALERNMDLFLEHGGQPLLGTHVPQGKDPDEFLRVGGAEAVTVLRKILAEAPAWLDVWAKELMSGVAPALQARTELLEKIVAKFALLKEDLWVSTRVAILAQGLGFREDLIITALRNKRGATKPANARAAAVPSGQNGVSHASGSPQKPQQKQKQNDKKSFGFEWQFLKDLVRYPNWISDFRGIALKDPQVLVTVAASEVGNAIRFLAAPLAVGETEEARLVRLVGESSESLSLGNFLTQALMERGGEPAPTGLFADAIQRLQKTGAKQKQLQLRRQIQAAEQQGDYGECQRLQRELTDLIRSSKLGEKE